MKKGFVSLLLEVTMELSLKMLSSDHSMKRMALRTPQQNEIV